MRIRADQSLEGLVYRRVLPHFWSERNKIIVIKPASFIPTPGQTLSVFNAAVVVSPRHVLQDHIDKQLSKLNDPLIDEANKLKLRRQLENGDLTVEALYSNRWRVVELPITVFPPELFIFDAPEPDGHQNVHGRYEDFETYSVEWSTYARILTEDECLAVH